MLKLWVDRKREQMVEMDGDVDAKLGELRPTLGINRKTETENPMLFFPTSIIKCNLQKTILKYYLCFS